MALAAKPTITVTIDYIDSTGSRGQSQTHLPASTLLAAAITKVDATVALITAVSGCAVTGYSISTGKTEIAAPAPGLNSRVERRAEFTFRTAAAKKANFGFPDPSPTVVNTNGGIISTQVDLAALITDLLGGYCDSNGSDLSALIADAQIYNRTTVRQMTTDTSPAT
jgi:hypothetical protein